MKRIAGLRGFLWLALVVAALGYGCGRTSLDEGLDPVTGLGGSTGVGGLAAGGQGGGVGQGGQAGFGAPNPCGTTTCRSRDQVCCTRSRAGQTTQSCVLANDPTACTGGAATACLDSSQCGINQTCCGSLLGQSSTCEPPGRCGTSPGQFILCTSNSGCPATAPRCCPLLQGVGTCVPATAGC